MGQAVKNGIDRKKKKQVTEKCEIVQKCTNFGINLGYGRP